MASTEKSDLGQPGDPLRLVHESSHGGRALDRLFEHALTVTAPDGIGGVLTERAIIIVGGRPVRAPR